MRTVRPRASDLHPVLWTGLAALSGGALLCVIGWYGMSGERYAERQLPYLASCTMPGSALIIAGAVLLTYGRSTVTSARVAELYELLVAGDPPERPRTGEPVTVPGGTLWHRADCPLVAGRPEVIPADGPTVASGGLGPCPVCEPPAGARGVAPPM
ncbi:MULTISPECIES: hypothetical protein [unclassified Streptomyces]|uniref:hypothetical protein n=1 Tax=unclassified Streptomyces TaxID=2593676 RepID=UPI000DBAD141|nr:MULTISPECIES: hypothetical protein [unclassified Streptomyces]MYT72791.1 hypothetical protein [Streptomyces sp. SID8367]RAJ78765.1 hypothetical protein K377_05371 [Streptomyces sp. PsTaAH-137]